MTWRATNWQALLGGGGGGGGLDGPPPAPQTVAAQVAVTAAAAAATAAAAAAAASAAPISAPVSTLPSLYLQEFDKARAWLMDMEARAASNRQGHHQGLTLVHILAQPEPFLSLTPAKHSNTWDKQCSR
jgi:hypothetical protein